MRLRCLIVDDEPNAVNLLEMFIQQNTSWDLLAKCYDAREALAFLKTHAVDLVFLDINMPHLTGMEMAALLPPSTRIVFTTAYSEFAAESYGFPTIDYLLKPITLKRFYAALQKIESYFSRPDHQPGASASPPSPTASASPTGYPPSPHPPEDEYFFVKSGRALQKILLKDILYFEGEKEYVRVVTPRTQITRLPPPQGHRRTTLRLLRPRPQFLYRQHRPPRIHPRQPGLRRRQTDPNQRKIPRSVYEPD
jgi:two-component system LytT family response regulator